jgi:hypothetical protein
MYAPEPLAGAYFGKFVIGPDDLVIIDERELRLSKEVDGGVILREAAAAKKAFARVLTWREIHDLVLAGSLTIRTRAE